MDVPPNHDATRTAARAALDLFAAPGSGQSWALDAPSPSLTRFEQTEVADGCYWLLLILAEAAPTPEEGLRRLDEAARLRPAASMAFHLRKRPASPARAARPRQEASATRLIVRRRPRTSITSWSGKNATSAATRARPCARSTGRFRSSPITSGPNACGPFAACNASRILDAKTGLTACLQREPRRPWLFLLRGFSSYQLALVARGYIEKLPAEKQALRAEAQLQLDAAADDYRRAADLIDPTAGLDLRFPLLVNQGLLKLERKEFGPAEADLKAAISLDGEPP